MEEDSEHRWYFSMVVANDLEALRKKLAGVQNPMLVIIYNFISTGGSVKLNLNFYLRGRHSRPNAVVDDILTIARSLADSANQTIELPLGPSLLLENVTARDVRGTPVSGWNDKAALQYLYRGPKKDTVYRMYFSVTTHVLEIVREALRRYYHRTDDSLLRDALVVTMEPLAKPHHGRGEFSARPITHYA